MKELYQFNLTYNNYYIKGYKLSEDENFIEIEATDIHCGANPNINAVDNIIKLSTKAIVCYFKCQ